MGIQKDAGTVLNTIYTAYVDKTIINPKLLKAVHTEGITSLKMSEKRIDRAVKYLLDLECVDIVFTFSSGKPTDLQPFIFQRLLPTGINIMENKKLFKKTFN